eukprot:jgi/Galph1/2164/GphlegSOOS_G850.1
MGNQNSKQEPTTVENVESKDSHASKVVSSPRRHLRLKGVASDLEEDNESPIDLQELREQRLRLSLDVEGEQLPAIRGRRTPKLPVTFDLELTRPPPIAAKISRKLGKSPRGSSVLHGTMGDTNKELRPVLFNQEISLQTETNLPLSYGACSLAGWEPVREMRGGQQARKENQDAYCHHDAYGGRANEALFGVFDGHGANGKAVAEFVREVLPVVIDSRLKELASNGEHAAEMKLVTKPLPETQHAELNLQYPSELKGKHQLDIVKAAIEGFVDCSNILNSKESNIDAFMSGTTAVVTWFYNSLLFCCNLGDSRCVVGRLVNPTSGSRVSKEKYISVDMSYDHKPIRKDESDRILSSGGRIASWHSGLGPLRVWLADEWIPGLAMSRSFGDSLLHSVGVIEVPEVTCLSLSEVDRFCVLASDGVWEFMSSQEVVEFVGKLRRKYSAQEAAEQLVQEAVRRWRKNEHVVDDVTAIVIWLNYKLPSPGAGSQNKKINTETLSSEQASSRLMSGGIFGSWKVWGSSASQSSRNTMGFRIILCFVRYQAVVIDKNGNIHAFVPLNHEG